MSGSESAQLLLSKDGVFIHVTTAQADEDVLLPGQVFIWSKPEGVFVEWRPAAAAAAAAAGEDDVDGGVSSQKDTDWTLVHSDSYSTGAEHKHVTSQPSVTAIKTHGSTSSQAAKYVVNFDIKDLKTFRRSRPSLGWSYLIFILKCGTTFPALHFHHGGTKHVIQELRKHLHIKTSPQDSCLYLVYDHDPQALFKSFDELQLFGPDQATDIISKFIQDPYSATMGGFSKVTHFLRDTLLTTDRSSPSADMMTSSELTTPAGTTTSLAVNSLSEAGFELITARELPPLPHVVRSLPVTAEQWSKYMDNEGRVTDVHAVKDAIFRGGVEPSIRTEVWKFLLGYYDWASTYKTRTELRKKKVDDYFRMKLQWKSIDADQESRFSELRDRRSLVEKDVARTDRTHSFFHGDHNPNITVLYDILLTHCMYNFDLGYVQGMSDLLAPILVVMENEVDAFWCFSAFIHMMGANFDKDQQAMKNQLMQLQILLTFVDPELANYLESQESSNMYFCFRWLLILFKREFSFPEIMRIWEVLWTGRPCQNFHLLLCIAVLISEKTVLIQNNFGFTEILKHINDMSGTLLVDDVLTLAEAIYLQLRSCRDLPSDIHDILALSSPHADHAYFSPFSSALPPTLPTASQQPSDSHVTQSLYSVQQVHGGSGEVVKATCGGDVTPTNDLDDGSIEILSESV